MFLDDGVTVIRKSLIQGTETIASVPFHGDNLGKVNIIKNFKINDSLHFIYCMIYILFFISENIEPVINNLNNNLSQKNIKGKLSPEEKEILEVQYREPLWNFKLPLAQRNNKITKVLWEEVSKALNGNVNVYYIIYFIMKQDIKTEYFLGKLSAAGCKGKFKNFHATYRRLINAEKLSSGSASKSNINKWKHYNAMDCLRNSFSKKVYNITYIILRNHFCILIF